MVKSIDDIQLDIIKKSNGLVTIGFSEEYGYTSNDNMVILEEAFSEWFMPWIEKIFPKELMSIKLIDAESSLLYDLYKENGEPCEEHEIPAAYSVMLGASELFEFNRYRMHLNYVTLNDILGDDIRNKIFISPSGKDTLLVNFNQVNKEEIELKCLNHLDQVRLKAKKKKVEPAKDPIMAKLIRTIYHSKIELNMNDIPDNLPLEEKAYRCWQARVDARRFARLLWKEHDISRYEYLEREFPERSFKDTLEYYGSDYSKIIDGSNRTNEQVDKMTFK